MTLSLRLSWPRLFCRTIEDVGDTDSDKLLGLNSKLSHQISAQEARGVTGNNLLSAALQHLLFCRVNN